MIFVVFNIFLFILLAVFLESKELKTYISYAKRQKLFLVNIVISNMIYLTGQVEVREIYMSSILAVAAYIDYQYHEIPDNSTILGIVIYIVYILMQNDIYMILNIDNLLSLIIYICFVVSCLLGFIGGGDIKIFLPISLILGGINFLMFLIITSFLVFILNMYQLLSKKRRLNDTIALAPYFYIAMIITVFLT